LHPAASAIEASPFVATAGRLEGSAKAALGAMRTNIPATTNAAKEIPVM